MILKIPEHTFHKDKKKRLSLILSWFNLKFNTNFFLRFNTKLL